MRGPLPSRPCADSVFAIQNAELEKPPPLPSPGVPGEGEAPSSPVVDYAALAPTSCLRARREPDGLVVELLPPGFRDAPGGILVFMTFCVVPMLAAAGRVLWLLGAMRLPLSAWGTVVRGAEGREAAGLFLLALATVPVYALLTALAWKGRSISGPATFHLTDDGWMAKRHQRYPCWACHRANVVGVRRRFGCLSLVMRAGHTLGITGGTNRRRRDLDWLEAAFRRYLGMPGDAGRAAAAAKRAGGQAE